MAQTNEAYEQRLAQADALEQAGIDLFPAEPHRPTHTLSQLHDSFYTLQGQEVQAVGRMIGKRVHGNISFVDLDDQTAILQSVINKRTLVTPEYRLFRDYFSEGDFVGTTGVLEKTQAGEISIFSSEMVMQAKSLRPIPQEVTDPETQQRQRYLDTLVNPDARERFRVRSRIVDGMRDYFTNVVGATEMETPILDTTYGGAYAKPFESYHNALKTKVYMRIANELYLKRMTVGGYYNGVFEFARDFRNEGMDRTHNPEFTMVELYKPFWDYRDLMQMAEQMMEGITREITGGTQINFGSRMIDVKTPWRRLPIREGIREKLGLDPDEIPDDQLRVIAAAHDVTGFTRGDLLVNLFEELWGDELMQPTFVMDYPADTSALAKRDPHNPDIAQRFEAYVGGIEVMNAYTELNDPRDQRVRFELERTKRSQGDEDAMPFDEDYLLAQEYGMPPQAGIGISIDRWTMLLTDTDHIRQTIYFPTLKPKSGNNAKTSETGDKRQEKDQVDIAERLGFTTIDEGYTKEIDGQMYTFSRVTNPKDLEKTVPLQQDAFDLSESDACPGHMLATLNKLGGFVIATMDAAGEVVGFSYTWPTAEKGTFLLDMIGVREDLRDKGIGYDAIKVLFLEAAKANVEKLLFTYDPLKVRNANVYLRKMGARVVSYEEDPYGGGLSGDRFLASWDISDPAAIVDRMTNKIERDPLDHETLPVIAADHFPDADMVLLPAPEDEEGLPSDQQVEWRAFYRKVGVSYFPSYIASAFLTERVEGGRRNNYVLQRQATPNGSS
ncbi:MAG: lysine--tRNA ligase [Candidatus Levybacteria bacterium]|nr:lysine--tRNA ligase [Candidatus Levybacteria bacterium]